MPDMQNFRTSEKYKNNRHNSIAKKAYELWNASDKNNSSEYYWYRACDIVDEEIFYRFYFGNHTSDCNCKEFCLPLERI